ncbi:MAG: arylsulfatase [Planctomycetota bacterium]
MSASLKIALVLFILNLGLLSEPLFGQQSAKQPNVLMIVADDMGYSDAGCFGGEIDTPSIDRLANSGIRFTNFYVNPMCVVTRTSLLTGHEHSQSNDYRNSLPIARLFQKAGYRTSISGKWHQPKNPLDAGFDAFYGFLKGEINGWLGTYSDNRTLAIQTDREPPKPVAGDWYCSDAFADHTIAQIDTALADNQPFFAYVAFNAPHGPLHAPRENVEKYYARFDEGWDKLRIKRMARMRDMNLIDDRYRSNQPEAEVCVWDELPESVQRLESKRFCAYAGMVDRMDQNIGRILKHLESTDTLDNTLVIFFSDNGGNYSHGSIHQYANEVPWSKLGPRPACATGWARLMNTPFSWYKTSAYRGGVSSPLIIHWPVKKSLKPGSLRKQRVHVSDLYPTLMEIIDQEYPATDGDRPLKPLYGRSMLPLLENPDLPKLQIRNEVFWGFEDTTKGLLIDDWKIISINDSPWRLYDLANDPCETNNLASSHPVHLQRLNDRWYKFANQETPMSLIWRKALRDDHQGWGLHRLQMLMPLESVSPAVSQLNVPTDTTLEFRFKGNISFQNTRNKTLRLYAVDAPDEPVWQIDPDETHPANGQNTLKFQLPNLKPSTTYYLLSDAGWIKLGNRAAGAINDGAYFYRFRTAQ